MSDKSKKRFRSEEQDEAVSLQAAGRSWGNAQCMDKKCGYEWFAIFIKEACPYLQCPKCKALAGQVKYPQKSL